MSTPRLRHILTPMSDPVTRLNTALKGRYAIERELGEGGMATVYLADDLKHKRKVALKVLKPEVAAVVGAERFLAEIQVTANLQHPSCSATDRSLAIRENHPDEELRRSRGR